MTQGARDAPVCLHLDHDRPYVNAVPWAAPPLTADPWQEAGRFRPCRFRASGLTIFLEFRGHVIAPFCSVVG